MKTACVYYHQGWTDIANCLGLVDFYKKTHDKIHVIQRNDSKDLFDYYIKNKSNIHPIYIKNDNGRYYGKIEIGNFEEIIYNDQENNHGTIYIPNSTNILFHAEHDIYRNDKYKYYWYRNDKKSTNHFSESFYTFYDIDFNERINSFNVNFDFDEINKEYDQFLQKNSSEYILYHDDENNSQHGTHHVSTKIKFQKIYSNINYFNLNKKSKKFFSYLKIFQNAKEIHLIDSIWAALYYQIDAKYNFFKNKEIFLYPLRGHAAMFTYPIKLKNWNIINNENY